MTGQSPCVFPVVAYTKLAGETEYSAILKKRNSEAKDQGSAGSGACNCKTLERSIENEEYIPFLCKLITGELKHYLFVNERIALSHSRSSWQIVQIEASRKSFKVTLLGTNRHEGWETTCIH